MKSLIIIIFLIIILVIVASRKSSWFVTENGPSSCQACPPLANGFKYTDPANGCATTACPEGYTTGTDPTNCSECTTGYSKTGTGSSAKCSPTITPCTGRQSVVNNICTDCNLPAGSIWTSATGCATTPCPQNSSPNASGTACTCANNYIADPTGTSCTRLSCSGRTQISGSPISTPPSGMGGGSPLGGGVPISIPPLPPSGGLPDLPGRGGGGGGGGGLPDLPGRGGGGGGRGNRN
jgi:hypothetical protein